MTPQIFRGRTLDEARRAAQVSLGDEAVIVTTRELRRPALLGLVSRSTFEVAALPPEPPKASNSGASATRSGVFAAANYQRDEGRPAFGEEIASLRAEMRREIRGVRQSVAYATTSRESPALEAELELVRLSLDLLREEAANGRRDPSQTMLRELGIEGHAAAMIGRALRGRRLSGEALREAVRAAAAELVPAAPWPLAREIKRVVALVGPTGAGKTTTIAKLAARAVLDHDKTVTLVACDSFRVGAVDHLRRYASLLRVKLQVATSRHDLESIVRDATSDLVLVDTGGRAPDLESAEGWLASRPRRARSADDAQPGLELSSREIDVLLCLPASLRARDVTRIAKTFAPLHPTALAITKLDETEAPAAIVHGPVTTRLPVSLVTFGQRVPEDIAQATVVDLVDALVPASRPLRAAQG